jgi:hypothetical protein
MTNYTRSQLINLLVNIYSIDRQAIKDISKEALQEMSNNLKRLGKK